MCDLFFIQFFVWFVVIIAGRNKTADKCDILLIFVGQLNRDGLDFRLCGDLVQKVIYGHS